MNNKWQERDGLYNNNLVKEREKIWKREWFKAKRRHDVGESLNNMYG